MVAFARKVRSNVGTLAWLSDLGDGRPSCTHWEERDDWSTWVYQWPRTCFSCAGRRLSVAEDRVVSRSLSVGITLQIFARILARRNYVTSFRKQMNSSLSQSRWNFSSTTTESGSLPRHLFLLWHLGYFQISAHIGLSVVSSSSFSA